MVRITVFLTILLAVAADPGSAEPPPVALAESAPNGFPESPNPSPPDSPPGIIYGTLSSALPGTTYFGGTHWDVADGRWEALPDSIWTFESGVASIINTDSTLKAVGLHSLMEGWVGVDYFEPVTGEYFRRDTTCAISGDYSFWAGVTQAEADSLGYDSGQGYGDNWIQTIGKTFNYPGSGTVTVQYYFMVDVVFPYGNLFDTFHVLVDTTGTMSADPVPVQVWGPILSPIMHSVVLTPGVDLPTQPGPFTVMFQAVSNKFFSDETDRNSTCGHTVIDNIFLSGAVVDSSDFETGDDGWSFITVPLQDGGDWSDIKAVADLSPPDSGCACTFGDSVLAFIDPNVGGGGHNDNTSNYAFSPWIDLAEHGGFGQPGKVVEFSGYEDLSFSGLIAYHVRVRWLPASLPSPKGTLPSEDGSYHAHSIDRSNTPVCFCHPNRKRIDISQSIPPNAEQVQIGIGVFNECGVFVPCPGTGTNESPWFDDVRLGVYSTTVPFAFSVFTDDLPRDAFPQDDSALDLISDTARFDSHAEVDYGVFGDTLVVRGPTQNLPGSRCEVVFRVHPGPGIDAPALSGWLSGFAAEGGSWYSARMDTAEVGGVVSTTNRYMTAFHEDDPQFQNNDTALDNKDKPFGTGAPSRLKNDMFPDDLFTPGTRVELFYRWMMDGVTDPISCLPDTAGENFFEMEVLPTSLVEDSPGVYSNNRVLYVSCTDNNQAARALVEGALTTLLPGGSGNHENTAWDRFDLVNGGDMMTAHPVNMEHEFNLDRYDIIIWNEDEFESYPYEYNQLLEWLNCDGGGPGGVNGCGRGLYFAGAGKGSGSSPFSRALGVDRFGIISNPQCEAIQGSSGPSHIGSQQTGFVDRSTAALLELRPSDSEGNHVVSLIYPNEAGAPIASITTHQRTRTGGSITGQWKSVYDGFPMHELYDASGCTGTQNELTNRLAEILTWFDAAYIVGAGPTDPRYRFAVRQNSPNPFFGATTIRFTLPREEMVTVSVFDLTGRRVAELLSARLPAGPHEISWDGRDDQGRSAASGIYLYRVETESNVMTRKLVRVGSR